jgi:hypothetical protein
VIVRLMGEGQFRVEDSELGRLNELDNAAVAALEAGDEAGFSERMQELHAAVLAAGEPVDPASLSASDLIVPPADLTPAEARGLFVGEGLIPDLPT